MTFTVGASESENLRSLWADGKSTGIFLTIEEAASLLIYGPIVGQSAVEKMFSAFPTVWRCCANSFSKCSGNSFVSESITLIDHPETNGAYALFYFHPCS